MIPKEKKLAIKEINHTNHLLTRLKEYATRCEYVGKKNYRYLNLKLFKNQIESQKTEESYKRQSYRLLFYRTIFYAFTFFFVGLAGFALSHTLAVSTTFFGNFEILPKTIVCALSLLLAGASFAFATSLCIAKESTNELVLRTKKQILEIFSSPPFPDEASYIPSWGQDGTLKHLYKSTMYAIEQKKDDTLFLLQEILRSKGLTPEEKRALFCHALDDMEEDLNTLIEDAKYRTFLTI